MGTALTVDNEAENGAMRLRKIEESLESDFKDYIHFRDRILAQLLEVREKKLYLYHGEEGGRRFTFEDWLNDMDARLGLKFASRQTFYTKQTLILMLEGIKDKRGNEDIVDRALAIRLAADHEWAVRQLMNGAATVIKTGRGFDADYDVEPTDAIPEFRDDPVKYLQELAGMSPTKSLLQVRDDTGKSSRIWVRDVVKVAEEPAEAEWDDFSSVLTVVDERKKQIKQYLARVQFQDDMPADVRTYILDKLKRGAEW